MRNRKKFALAGIIMITVGIATSSLIFEQEDFARYAFGIIVSTFATLLVLFYLKKDKSN